MSDQPKYTRKVAIVGSRNYPDLEEVRAFVRGLDQGVLVVSGGAEGVDTVAAEEADKLGFDVLVIEPDYDRFPPQRAPLERNTYIVAEADEVVAFQGPCEKCPPLGYRCPASGNSHGTQDTIKKAIKAGKPVRMKLPGRAWKEY